MGLFEKLFGNGDRSEYWDDEEARAELRKGDIRHIYIKEDGSVSVSRRAHGRRNSKPTKGKAYRLEDEIRKASRCKPGRKAGPPVIRKVNPEDLP